MNKAIEESDHSEKGEMIEELVEEIRPLADDPETGHILVVDDNETNRLMLERRLTRDGHKVTTLSNGAAALERLAAGDIDLVLLDLMMPEMNGYQVLSAMKAEEGLLLVPVIILTGLEEEESAIRCLEAGAEDYLTKPFNALLLRTRINSCLKKKFLFERA